MENTCLFKIKIVALPPLELKRDFKDAVKRFKAKLNDKSSSLYRNSEVSVRLLSKFSKNFATKIANEENFSLVDLIEVVKIKHQIAKAKKKAYKQVKDILAQLKQYDDAKFTKRFVPKSNLILQTAMDYFR